MCTQVDSRKFEEVAVVAGTRRVGPGLFELALKADRTAAAIRPGQFVHLLLDAHREHILRRPFSVYRIDDAGNVVVLYQVVGKGSALMGDLRPGDPCSLIAPLGNVWPMPAGDGRVLIVCGGLGSAPLFMFAQRLACEGVGFDVVLGARSAAHHVARERYAALIGREPVIATDDGSLGYAGFATEPAREMLATGAYSSVYCCGPDIFMKLVAGIASDAGVSCWVSEEKRMACGVGACLSCVVETTAGKRRSCVDGPVFDAKDVVWA